MASNKKSQSTLELHVSLPSSLSSQLHRLVKDKDLAPPPLAPPSPTNPVSLLGSDSSLPLPSYSPSLVYWRGPNEKDHPWTGQPISHPVSLKVANILLFVDRTITKDVSIEERRKRLPIYQIRSDIVSTVRANTVTIVSAPTGSGKSTQVVQYLYESYSSCSSLSSLACVVLNPHRVSALYHAHRVAEERGGRVETGGAVGYATRMDCVLARPHGSIMYMTSDEVLRRMEGGLRGVSHVIIDEVQERDIYTDVLLSLLRDMARKCPAIRIIILCEPRSSHFFHSFFSILSPRVVDIPTPVGSSKVMFLDEYLPQLSLPDCTGKKSIDLTHIILPLLSHISSLPPGTVVVYIPQTRSDIYHKVKTAGMDTLSLFWIHSQSSLSDVQQAFGESAAGKRKVIFTSELGECCLAFDTVRYVIDSCQSCVKQTSSTGRLFFTRVRSSRTVCERRGRGEGEVTVYRLITRSGYESLDPVHRSEMQSAPLMDIVLLLKLLGLCPVNTLFSRSIDPIPPARIEETVKMLTALSLLSPSGCLTDVGARAALLPVEARWARSILLGERLGVASEMCVLAAASALSTPFEEETPESFVRDLAGDHPSDHAALLGVNAAFQKMYSENGHEAALIYCKEHKLRADVLLETRAHCLRLYFCVVGWEQEWLPLSPSPPIPLISSLLIYYDSTNAAVSFKNKKARCLHKNRGFAVSDGSLCLRNGEMASPLLVGTNNPLRPSFSHLSCISPLQLLVFGTQPVDAASSGTVVIDNLLRVCLPVSEAVVLCSLRRLLTSLLHSEKDTQQIGRILEDLFSPDFYGAMKSVVVPEVTKTPPSIVPPMMFHRLPSLMTLPPMNVPPPSLAPPVHVPPPFHYDAWIDQSSKDTRMHPYRRW